MAEDPADRSSAARPQRQEAVLRRGPAAAGLAGRPGQRRAVRTTAVALGMLAVSLGVRDAVRDDPAAPADVPRPVTSAPADPGGHR